MEKEIVSGSKNKLLKKESIVGTTTYDELKSGLEEVENRVKTNQDKLKQSEARIAQFGKKPLKTSEMIRLQKNLEALNKIGEIEKLENQNGPLKEMIEIDKKFIAQRTRILQERPEK